MVNKKIKAVKEVKQPKAPKAQKAPRAQKAQKAPRAPRAPRQPAQPKKTPTQNVYIYSGGGNPPIVSRGLEQQVYIPQPIPQQFIQPQIQNPFLNLVQSQPVQQQTEIAQEDRLERTEPKIKKKEIIIIPSEPVQEESLWSELFTTPESVKQAQKKREEEEELKPKPKPIFWETFNPDYNMTEGELDYRLADAERRYREQQRYLGQIKDTKAEPIDNILLIPNESAEENIFRPQTRPRKKPTIIKTQPPEEIQIIPSEAVQEEYIIPPEQQSDYERIMQRTRQFQEEQEKKKPLKLQAEEEEIETLPEFPVERVEVIQRPTYNVLQPAEEEERLQEVIERVAQKEKELDQPAEEGRIEELGQRAEAVSPIQAEVKRNPVGKPKGGVIEDYIPQPNNDLAGEEEAVRMAMYDELTTGKNRDQLANEITAFTEKNSWAKTFRDERGNKIARTSETLRDELGNPIKTSSGKGNRQRDFNVGEMKSILDKLIIEKIKRERE